MGEPEENKSVFRKITAEELATIASHKSTTLAQKHVDDINAAMEKYEINTPLRQSHFLSQILTETGGLRGFEENLRYTTPERLKEVWPSKFKTVEQAKPYLRNSQKLANYVYAGRNGNGIEKTGEGYKYRGRGMIHLTGKNNYLGYSKASGNDVTTNPELVSSDYAADAAGWFWQSRGINVEADKDKVEKVSALVNPPLEGFATRKEYLKKAKEVLSEKDSKKRKESPNKETEEPSDKKPRTESQEESSLQDPSSWTRPTDVDDEGTRDISKAIVVNLPPDVCLTPIGSGMVPVPYPIIGRFNTVMRMHQTVHFTKMEVFTENSRITTVTGDEAGTGGGVKSSRNVGYCRSIVHSTTVRVEGYWVVRNNDPMEMNMNGPDGIGNTVGRIIYVEVMQVCYIGDQGEIVGDTNPPLEPETEEEIGFWGQVGGFFKGAWDAGVETVEGVVTLAKGAYSLSPVGILTNPQGALDTIETIQKTGSAIVDNPGMLWDAITKPYTEAWADGRYGEAIGRGTFEAVSIILGTKGVDKVAKGAKVADAVGDVARVADDVARVADDVARVGDDVARVADDVARVADDVAETADDVARASDEAADAARVGDDGAHVTRMEVPSVRGGAFRRWFDELTPDEFDEIWADPALREKIKSRLRHPGGQHEWLLVSRANVFKRWGMSADDIAAMRTPIGDVAFVNPAGRHGGLGSTTAHNEILGIIDNADDFNGFRGGLQNWADNRLQGGSASLSEGLRPNP